MSGTLLTSGPSAADPIVSRRSPRPWRDRFRVAVRGIKFGIRGHSTFFVHFFCAMLVVAAAKVLSCSIIEWCLLVGCIGSVLTAELFNSAIETLFRGLDEEAKSRAWPALDIAAGAVLLASIAAGIVGCIIFLPKLAAWLHLA